MNEKEYYEETANWSFDEFEIKEEKLTNWDLYEILRYVTNENSKILDLGTGGGEKVLKYFPDVKEILATDYSHEMIKTANKNLELSGRKNITFRVMDNLKMDVKKNYYDVVVARNTVTDLKAIYEALKKNGYVLIHGVDKYDCHELKRIFGYGQAYFDKKPISIVDYENALDAGFKDVELVPIHSVEYFKSKELFYKFLKKVHILDDFSEETENENLNKKEIDQDLLDQYVENNTSEKGIRLVRRYYGITGRK